MKKWIDAGEFSVLEACQDLHGFAQGHLQAMPEEMAESARLLESRLSNWRPSTAISQPYDDIVRALASNRPKQYRKRQETYPGIAAKLAVTMRETPALTADLILRYAYYRTQGQPALTAYRAARRK